MKIHNTKARALAAAKNLLQAFDYNGFSFQHLADAIGIKKQSLLGYFKSKAALGKSLIEDHHLGFARWAETVSMCAPEIQIAAFFDLLHSFSLDCKKICPLAAMIADFNSFPKGMKVALTKLYQTRLVWLESIIKQGQSLKIFRIDQPSDELANLVLSNCIGIQLIARVSDNPDQIKKVKEQVLKILQTD